jgi:hypothetical protein
MNEFLAAILLYANPVSSQQHPLQCRLIYSLVHGSINVATSPAFESMLRPCLALAGLG